MIHSIIWSDHYNIEIDYLDKEHKKLFEILNRLISDYVSKPLKIINDSFYELFHYEEEHFQLEEEFMEKINYPEFQRHKKQHNKFKKRIAYMCDELTCNANPHSAREELLAYLREWFEFHILGEDMKYAAFYKKLQSV